MTRVTDLEMFNEFSCKIYKQSEYIPLVGNLKTRIILGFFLLISSLVLVGLLIDRRISGFVILVAVIAWVVTILFTDMYVHKYPQRYFSYLFVSHLKAAVFMATFLWIITRFTDSFAYSSNVLWTGLVCFIVVDALVSIPRRRKLSAIGSNLADVTHEKIDQTSRCQSDNFVNYVTIDTKAIFSGLASNSDTALNNFIKKNLPNSQGNTGSVLLLDDVPNTVAVRIEDEMVGLIVGQISINHVRRLNKYLEYCVGRIVMGGYLVVRYTSLENTLEDLRRRHPGLLYWPSFIINFLWVRAIPKIPGIDKLYFSPLFSWIDDLRLKIAKRRNRVLSKAEAWGRLAYFGMHVIDESEGDGEVFLIARRVEPPIKGRMPSYYPVVALEKVGLGGAAIHTHKLRTMYPFSEFLQKRLYEDHGLASTGKFKNDFRLTEIGRFLRRYWLDELPQLFDWLRGDIKLVGMRATSRHFLSLYPKELYDLYVQIKPGLIPPIFDESTSGFDQIVNVELTYLKSYWKQPIRTDVKYLIRTFTDIVFRGVRSK